MLLTRTLTAAVLCFALSPALAKPAPHAKVTAHAKSEARAKTAAHAKATVAHAKTAYAKASANAENKEPIGRLLASVYWEGQRVATGQRFDPSGMTVAHKSLPLGTRLVVSYGRNAAEVIVNDRGPYVRGREIDLTRGVAHALHFPGLGKVRVVYWPPLPRPRPGTPIELSDN